MIRARKHVETKSPSSGRHRSVSDNSLQRGRSRQINSTSALPGTLNQADHRTYSAQAREKWDALSSLAELVTPSERSRAEFIEACKSGKYDGVTVAYRTFGSVSITGLWDEELVSAVPKSLKFLCHNGAGYDQVDVHACSARDPPIKVSNVPTAVDDATADTNMFLILGALRGFNTSMFALRESKWKGHPPPPLGHDPEGKTLGILGMGGIGRNLKKKAEAFGMRVVYHNRRKLSDELSGGAPYVGFEELLKTSDVLSLNLPLNVSCICASIGSRHLGC